ncbi:MAG TPA: TetR family transcriptional regulator [Acidimicrobiales bacterium]
MPAPSDEGSELEARRRDPRYQRLMAATREVARGGYDAVSMRELAEITRMSLTTIYQFCSSKDHLIAEAHLERMEAFRHMLSHSKRGGGTVEERVLRVVRGIVNALERDEVMTRTLMRAMYSVDPGVAEVSKAVGTAYRDMVDDAIGDDDLPDREAVIETLGRVIDSAIYGWVARGSSVADVRDTLEKAVRVLVGSCEQPRAARSARRRRSAPPTRTEPVR